jgi:hypothetical protein
MLLSLVEEIVAPLDGCAQCLVTLFGGPHALRQKVESVAEALGDLARREGLHSGGGQFDGQWHSVQVAADATYDLVVVPKGVVWGEAGRALNEQLDCVFFC